MGKRDDSNVSNNPGTSQSVVSRLSKQSRNASNSSSRIRDPFIVERVNQYLNDNKHLAYIEINDMVDALRHRHREYRRRNWTQFKILVERAFKAVSKRAGLPDNMNLSDSSSEVEECNNSPAVNNSNSQIMNLYQTPQQDRASNANNSQELINLSSDDDDDNDPTRESVILPVNKLNRPGEESIPPGPINNPDQSIYRRQRTYPGTQRSKNTRTRFPGSDVTFADFGGSSTVLEEVCKLIVHIKHPEVFRHLGVSAPRGFLLHGPPGCGKTLLASAIAGELGLPFIKVSGPELVGGVSGESEERVRDLFMSALDAAPCVLFIDEVDVISPNRETAQREMERRIVAQLLSSLDDLSEKDTHGQVLVIGATKRPEALDPALRRAGRFDREVSLGIPDEKAREQILRVLCSKVNFSQELDLATIARMTPGYVGADLLSLIREAAMVAITRFFEKLQRQRLERKNLKRKRALEDEVLNPKRVPEADEVVVENGTKEEVNEVKSLIETESENKREETVTESSANGENSEERKNQKEGDDDVAMVVAVVNSNDQKGEEIQIDELRTVRKQNVPDNKKITNEELEMDVSIDILRPSSLNTLLAWVREAPALSSDQLRLFRIEPSDLNVALRSVQPSAKREGFATVPDVTWDDVGSLASVREHLKMTILGPIKYQTQFERLGLVAPAGVLLCGPPGCGKTLLAKAVANEAGINFISVKGPELLNMYVGESERAVRTVFQRARNSAPCVIFFDELDSLCPRRTEGDAGAGVRVVNQMLTEMDGVGDRRGVFLMAATNRPDIVDPAVLRPGRLDRTIYIGLPNAQDRKDILLAITKNGTKPPLGKEVSLGELAARPELENWTGADLAALMREAAMQAVREATADLCVISTADLKCESTPTDIFVTQAHVEHALKVVRPSVSELDLIRYEQMRKQFAEVPGAK